MRRMRLLEATNVDVTKVGSVTNAISVGSSVIPTGAATEATAALIKAKTDNLDVALSLIKAKTDNLDVALSTRFGITDIQPSSAGSIFNTALPAAEANWFGADISITSAGTMRVAVQATVAGILRAAITRSATQKMLNLNQNAVLSANALYVFDIPVKSGDTLNLKYSVTSGTIDYCEVQFIKGAA